MLLAMHKKKSVHACLNVRANEGGEFAWKFSLTLNQASTPPHFYIFNPNPNPYTKEGNPVLYTNRSPKAGDTEKRGMGW